MIPNSRAAAMLAAVAALAGASAVAIAAHPSPSSALIRVNQVGFAPTAPKLALLMTERSPRPLPFQLVTAHGRVVFRARAGADEGEWSRTFTHVRELDFTRFRRTGSYRVVVPSLHARSASFRIARGASLYAGPAARAVRFFRAQRDGAVASGGPAHMNDAHARLYAPPSAAQLFRGSFTPAGATADVSGGWFDAGDYLKFAETTSFADTLMLWAERDHPGRIPALAAEARTGLDWLMRAYDPAAGALVYQVGVGDGHSGWNGDHDLWRLPQRDDHLEGSANRLLAHRPAFVTRAPFSPNLAGRIAAAFGLCAQVYRASDPAYADRCLADGKAIFSQARTSGVGTLLTSAPHAYYPEAAWRDDMALGATELFKAVAADPQQQSGARGYLDQAGHWADQYASGAGADSDSMNLYDVEALADFDLGRVLQSLPPNASVPTDPGALAADLHDQLRIGIAASRHYPFRLANPNTWTDSVTHALGYSITAQLYDRLAGTQKFAAFGQHQLDWVLGANPWGSSFAVGAGSVFPHCLQHQPANLSYGLTGRGRVLGGATVGGPTARTDLGALGAPDRFRRCSVSYARFDGHGAVYRDDVRSAPTSEPTDDATALALLAFSERF